MNKNKRKKKKMEEINIEENDKKRKSEDVLIEENKGEENTKEEVREEKGFATASGKKIKIDEKLLEQAKTLISNVKIDKKMEEAINQEQEEIEKQKNNPENGKQEKLEEEKEENFEEWDENKVINWLSTLDLQRDYSSNINEHKITGKILSEQCSSKEELKKYGITIFGDVKKILRARSEKLGISN